MHRQKIERKQTTPHREDCRYAKFIVAMWLQHHTPTQRKDYTRSEPIKTALQSPPRKHNAQGSCHIRRLTPPNSCRLKKHMCGGFTTSATRLHVLDLFFEWPSESVCNATLYIARPTHAATIAASEYHHCYLRHLTMMSDTDLAPTMQGLVATIRCKPSCRTLSLLQVLLKSSCLLPCRVGHRDSLQAPTRLARHNIRLPTRPSFADAPPPPSAQQK